MATFGLLFSWPWWIEIPWRVAAAAFGVALVRVWETQPSVWKQVIGALFGGLALGSAGPGLPTESIYFRLVVGLLLLALVLAFDVSMRQEVAAAGGSRFRVPLWLALLFAATMTSPAFIVAAVMTSEMTGLHKVASVLILFAMAIAVGMKLRLLRVPI